MIKPSSVKSLDYLGAKKKHLEAFSLKGEIHIKTSDYIT